MASLDLKTIRARLGLTQRGMGEIMGISGSFYANIESGRERLPVKREQKLIEYLATWITVLQYHLDECEKLKRTIKQDSKREGWQVFDEKYSRIMK